MSSNIVNPNEALQRLKDGNANYLKNALRDRDLMAEVEQGCGGQTPFATVLSCIDSRMPAEMIFDQGIGDIFSIRIAGNFVNQDILGSMEFACRVSTTRLLVVMGHTACGAVKGACDHVELGNLTNMLENIAPAVNAVSEPSDASQRNSSNADFVNSVAEKNVHLTIDRILNESEVLSGMVNTNSSDVDNHLKVIGAMYNTCTGEVTFFD